MSLTRQSILERKRALSDSFMDALLHGVLNPILKRVQVDETLLIALRGSYINIYYRGGNLIKISEQQGGTFSGEFDLNYIEKGDVPFRDKVGRLQKIKLDDEGVSEWIDAIPSLKLAIDLFLGRGSDKHEREFQQLVARENNYSGISNETEYFIADIEYAIPELGARFDLLGIQWLANKRKNGSNCRLALIEMKYGDDALDGKSGLREHMAQIQDFLKETDALNNLAEDLGVVFQQMRDLRLIRFGESKGNEKAKNENIVKIDPTKPEIIFLLANHNPRNSKLQSLLEAVSDPTQFDLRFFVASFAGYGLHSHCMLKLDEFQRRLKME